MAGKITERIEDFTKNGKYTNSNGDVEGLNKFF